MKFREKLIHKILMMAIVAALFVTFASCEDDDNGKPEEVEATNAFFLSVRGSASGGGAGPEYIMLVEDVESGEYHISDNLGELASSGYTWIFNTSPSAAIGLIYNQGDPGVGLGYGIDTNGNLTTPKQFLITSRYTSYGFFDKYALTHVGGQVPLDENQQALTYPDGTERTDGVVFNFIDLENDMALENKAMTTLNITGNGDQATPSGIVDMGNGEFLVGLVVSQAIDESATGGSSSGTVNYPDSVWVAALDVDLNVKRIYRSDKISYSSGRYRSQYYSQIGKADDGSVYVFSGSYDSETTRPAGALRINKGAEDFDSSYYFDIENATGGYRFKRVWHITGDYFLIEFYNEPGIITSTLNPSTQYGVVNMTAQSFNWLKSGFPDMDEIEVTGIPMAYKGKLYFPIVTTTEYPTIYVIDPSTATAAKGLVINGAYSIGAVGRLVAD